MDPPAELSWESFHTSSSSSAASAGATPTASPSGALVQSSPVIVTPRSVLDTVKSVATASSKGTLPAFLHITIAPSIKRTIKYFISLAQGLNPVSKDWLAACIAGNQLLPPLTAHQSFLLLPTKASPFSAQEAASSLSPSKGQISSSLHLRMGLTPLPRHERCLTSLQVLVVGSNKRIVLEWQLLMCASGAVVMSMQQMMQAKGAQAEAISLAEHSFSKLASFSFSMPRSAWKPVTPELLLSAHSTASRGNDEEHEPREQNTQELVDDLQARRMLQYEENGQTITNAMFWQIREHCVQEATLLTTPNKRRLSSRNTDVAASSSSKAAASPAAATFQQPQRPLNKRVFSCILNLDLIPVPSAAAPKALSAPAAPSAITKEVERFLLKEGQGRGQGAVHLVSTDWVGDCLIQQRLLPFPIPPPAPEPVFECSQNY